MTAIFPAMFWASPAWWVETPGEIATLKVAYNAVAWWITGLPLNTRTTNLITFAHLPPMEAYLDYLSLQYAIRLCNGWVWARLEVATRGGQAGRRGGQTERRGGQAERRGGRAGRRGGQAEWRGGHAERRGGQAERRGGQAERRDGQASGRGGRAE